MFFCAGFILDTYDGSEVSTPDFSFDDSNRRSFAISCFCSSLSALTIPSRKKIPQSLKNFSYLTLSFFCCSSKNLIILADSTSLSFLIRALSWSSSRLRFSGISSLSTTPFTNRSQFGRTLWALDWIRTFLL